MRADRSWLIKRFASSLSASVRRCTPTSEASDGRQAQRRRVGLFVSQEPGETRDKVADCFYAAERRDLNQNKKFGGEVHLPARQTGFTCRTFQMFQQQEDSSPILMKTSPNPNLQEDSQHAVLSVGGRILSGHSSFLPVQEHGCWANWFQSEVRESVGSCDGRTDHFHIAESSPVGSN